MTDFGFEELTEKDEMYFLPKSVKALDFKFLNNGNGTTYITNVFIDILDVKVDTSPSLSFRYGFNKADEVVILATNTGWGSATILSCILKNDELGVFSQPKETFPIHIPPSEYKIIAKLTPNDINGGQLGEYENALALRKEQLGLAKKSLASQDRKILGDNTKLMSSHDMFHVNEFFQDLKAGEQAVRQKWHVDFFNQEFEDSIPLNKPFLIEINFNGESTQPVQKTFSVAQPDREGGQLWWKNSRFHFEANRVAYSLMPPKDIYAVLLKPELINQSKSYSISHFIKSGDVERIHFLFASEKTADYKIKIRFKFNKAEILTSEEFSISLFTENKPGALRNIKDGQHLNISNNKLRFSRSEYHDPAQDEFSMKDF